MFPARGLVKDLGRSPSPSNGTAQTYVPLKLESSTRTSGLLNRSVELREIMHLTCLFIHDLCYLIYDCMLNEIDILYGMLCLTCWASAHDICLC